MTLQIGQTLDQGRYKIEKRLGQGGMGTVYLAVDGHNPQRKVAIKENREPSRRLQIQFRQEAETLARLDHPNLPRIVHSFTGENNFQYLVMDYIDGDTLKDIQSRRTVPLLESDIREWVTQIMDALEYMHTWVEPYTGQVNPIIHRDIKPENIKLSERGKIYLVDFGISKLDTGDRTRTGARAYSTGFSPIEQYTGGTDVRSDIYSLGATLYSLLTRTLPTNAPDIASGKPLHPPRQINPAISRQLERVILKAMSLRPDERYNTVAEMRAALDSRWPGAPFAVPRLRAPGEPKPIEAKPTTSRPLPPTAPVTPSRTSWSRSIAVLLLLIAGISIYMAITRIPDLATTTTTSGNQVASASLKPIATDSSVTAESESPDNETADNETANKPTNKSSPETTLSSNPDEPKVIEEPLTSTATPATQATRKPTVTPIPVNTRPPSTIAASLSEEPTDTSAATGALSPAATREPTPTKISKPSTSTPTETPSNTPAPTQTATRMSSTATPTLMPGTDTAMLQSPLEATLRGVYTFRWQSDYMLVGNQAFEVVLWKNGQSAFIDGLGPAGVTTQSELRIDLDQAMALIPQLMAGQDYRWGILLVETIPYRRVKYLGGDQLFRLERNDNGSGSSGGSNGGGASKPTQVPTATPRG